MRCIAGYSVQCLKLRQVHDNYNTKTGLILTSNWLPKTYKTHNKLKIQLRTT